MLCTYHNIYQQDKYIKELRNKINNGEKEEVKVIMKVIENLKRIKE